MSIELDNSFTVPVAPERAWDVLLDVERIAPAMPGATVESVEDDVVSGRLKVKVGPVQLTYRGTAKFTERDPQARVVVVEASGKEARGAGTASATVRASLEPDPSGGATTVTMHTTMNVTGRPAQFGRGVLAEVSGKLVEQFAANLAAMITGDTGTAGAAGGTGAAGAAGNGAATAGAGTAGRQAAAPGASGAAASAAAAPVAQQGETSLNLVRLVGPAVLKRAVPVAAAAAGLAVLAAWLRRLFRRRRS
jgi:carbon monoxide dehydrogenase subunit G